jgi:sugar lactone lactonase YvrE
MTRDRARRSFLTTSGRVILGATVSVAVLLLTYFAAFRPPGESFEPSVWSPEPALAVPSGAVDGEPGRSAAHFSDVTIHGPEDIEIDERGRVYTGTQDGAIIRILESGETQLFADVGGRPLGLVFDRDGSLLVANHGVGLQRVTPQGEVKLLTDVAEGTPIHSANDVAVAANGIVYLSDSNPKYNSTTLPGLSSYSLYDFLEGRPVGRVIAYDPRTDETTQLITELHFPNGLLLDEDEASLLVTESTRFRISRHWLSGRHAGGREIFLDNVPGILDGITRDDGGRIYLPMYDRVDALERFVLPSGFMRQIVVRIPAPLIGARGTLSGSILVIDGEGGEIIRQLTGFDPAVSNVALSGGDMILGSLEADAVRVAPRYATSE